MTVIDYGYTSTLRTSDLVRSAKRLVQGGAREVRNILDADFSASADSLTVRYPLAGIGIGQTIEIGWCEYSIVDMETSTRTLRVIPEIEGSAVDHVAGARILMRPRYPVRRIIEEINYDLGDLTGAGLYRVMIVAAVDGTVTLPEAAITVLDAWTDETTPRRVPAAAYRIVDTPTGAVLRGPGHLGQVALGTSLRTLSSTDDELVAETTGLFPEALDLPPMGAALRLLAGSESQRNLVDVQGDTRRATEVQPGAVTTALRNIANLRQSRLAAEVGRMHQRFGYTIDMGV